MRIFIAIATVCGWSIFLSSDWAKDGFTLMITALIFLISALIAVGD